MVKPLSYRSQVKSFLDKHIQEQRRYRFVVDDCLHLIDSTFIINEIIDASDDEIDILHEVFEQLEPNEESIHDYLEYMAQLYVKTNR
ncbi:hypothetical protein [Shouchella tritolerans]|uniref:hypothetical protein n=1 Tax=Shouchella tritolerans TaxID=2979466 RepID=UPI0021E90EFF|nr:hypothetical protein [Shouchella tritolerans]